MADLFPVTLDEQIACVKREFGMRESVYARRVSDKKMTQITADKELAHMRAVLATLELVGKRPGYPFQVVPTEPTEAMLVAGNKAGLSTGVLMDDTRFSVERATYAAMIGAAP